MFGLRRRKAPTPAADYASDSAWFEALLSPIPKPIVTLHSGDGSAGSAWEISFPTPTQAQIEAAEDADLREHGLPELLTPPRHAVSLPRRQSPFRRTPDPASFPTP